MKKKTLMITGASGFVGRNFIEKYKDDYNIIPVSLRDRKVEELDFTGVDTILHLAALVHQMKGAPEEKYFQINTELTKKLAEKAKENGVKHFVFYSTVAVWGTHGYFDHEKIITLNTPLNPKTPYAKSKLKAEKILNILESENFKITIVRPPMVYGKNCPGNMKRLEKLVDILPILPFGNDENKRTLVHIGKLLKETNEIIIKEKNRIVIPRDEKDKSIRDVIEYIFKEKKKRKILIKLPKFCKNILIRVKPQIVESLYGSLSFKEEM